MTDEELNAIRERLARATPGPWHVFEGDDYEVWGGSKPRGEGMVWRPDWTDEDDEIAAMYPRDDHEADAHLIAHAPADLAALLAEVERLRARDATLMEIARAVASPDTKTLYGIIDDEEYEPQACIFGCALRYTFQDGMSVGTWEHTMDCPVTKARALLAKESQP
jgi:hypothetical protein